jgi:hypothetical protein
LNANPAYPNWSKLRAALTASKGGLLVRRSTHIGGGLYVEGIKWRLIGQTQWVVDGYVPSIFDYQLHIKCADDCINGTTGALQVSGGGFFAKDLRCLSNLHVSGITNLANVVSSGIISVTNTENASTTPGSGSIQTSGGLRVAQDAIINGSVSILGSATVNGLLRATTVEGNLTLGEITTSKDVTFGHSLYLGTNAGEVGVYFNDGRTYAATPNITCPELTPGNTGLLVRTVKLNGLEYVNALFIKSSGDAADITMFSETNATSRIEAALRVSGGLAVNKDIWCNNLKLDSTDNAVSAVSGALSIPNGGISVGKDIFCVGKITAASLSTVDSGVTYDLKQIQTEGFKSVKNFPTLKYVSAQSIAVTPGSILDSTYNVITNISAEITKSIATTWVVGSGNGALLSSLSLEANTTYHMYVIYNATDKIADILAVAYHVADISLPVGYTYKRYIGSVLTNSSSEIIPFTQLGNKFLITPQLEIDNQLRDSNQTYLDIQRVARGIKAEALLSIKGSTQSTTSEKIVLSNTHHDLNTQYVDTEIEIGFTSGIETSSSDTEVKLVVSNNSAYSRIFITHSSSNGTYTVKTKGWVDHNL